jgi:hypothetical protein
MRVGRVWPVVAIAMIMFAGCGDDDSESDTGSESAEVTASEGTGSGNGSTPDADGSESDGPTAADGDSSTGEVAGSWQLSQQTFDQNANYELDDDELATATGPEYGIYTLEISDDGSCTFSDESEQGLGTCQLGPCDELIFTDFDCDLLGSTGERILAIENGPTSATTLGGRYGVLGLTNKELVLKDITGSMGTIYVYKPA